jgi:hypothetical protein
LSGDEFVGWQAYNAIAPLDLAQRLEQIIAQLTALTANANKGKSGKKYKTQDFMPDYTPKKQQTGDQMIAAMNKFYRRV